MVRLSDYLSYLNNEIAQARKKMDIEAIERAKEYANDEYLKYFKAPRFVMPSIKLELPIKISELDSNTTYDFKMNKEAFLESFNKKILNIGKEYSVNLQPLKRVDLNKKEFTTITKELDKKEIVGINGSFNEVIIKQPFQPILRGIKPFTGFSVMDEDKNKEMKIKIDNAFNSTIKEQYKPIRSNLKNVFIQPDTNSLKKSGNDKILVKLSIELLEENLQIIKLTDANGKEYEEIIID